MRLKDIKTSILDMPYEEEERIHRDIRKSRLDFKKETRRRKPPKVKERKKTMKSLNKIESKLRKDPAMIKELIKMLEE
jgi:uncharacterized membrane-anchored protein YjiN (DUF445 family)